MQDILQSDVFLDSTGTNYIDKNNNKYTRVSHVLGMIKKPFMTGMWASKKAKELGVEKSEVLDMWDKKRDAACDHGTRIHEALEDYHNKFIIKPENEHMEPMIKTITAEFNGYYRTLNEVSLYDPVEKIAGTADKICILKKSKTGRVDIKDYKTNLNRGIEFENKYGEYMLGPVSHLMNCNFNTYALQLTCYAYMLQEYYGVKIGTLEILYIPPDNPLAWRKIPVNYMKREWIDILEWTRDKRNNVKPVYENTEEVFGNEPQFED